MASSYDSRMAGYSDMLFGAAVAVQGQRSQLANYAINKAAQYMQDNKTDEAIREFKKALAFDPQNDTALTYMGKLYMQQGKNLDAIKTFKDLVRQQPLSVNAKVNLGNAYLQDKNYTESEKAFKDAARLDPLNPLADYTLGHQYLQTGRLKEAEAQFFKAQRAAPKDGNVYYGLGAVYNKMEKFEQAVTNLKKALSLKEKFPAANLELGMAYNSLGNTEEAQKQLSILQRAKAPEAEDLKFILNKPSLIYMDSSKSGGFSELLGSGTPLWMLDVDNLGKPDSLANPDTSKKFTITFQFNNEMDLGSVMNPLNWSITRGNNAAAGYYNDTIPLNYDREALVAPIPLSVTYDSLNRQAMLTFRVNQNEAGDATIDPKHLVFKFSGKDAAGRQMDTTADEIDGYSLKAF